MKKPILNIDKAAFNAFCTGDKIHIIASEELNSLILERSDIHFLYQEHENSSGTLINRKCVSKQDIVFLIDMQDRFLVLVNNRLLGLNETLHFAWNNGNIHIKQLREIIEQVMEPHCFYKKKLSAKLIHFTDFKYPEL